MITAYNIESKVQVQILGFVYKGEEIKAIYADLQTGTIRAGSLTSLRLEANGNLRDTITDTDQRPTMPVLKD